MGSAQSTWQPASSAASMYFAPARGIGQYDGAIGAESI
jgi:hypothetical protein